MADLIDRQALLEKAFWVNLYGGNKSAHVVYSRDIHQLPAVDAVVLPCKVGDTVWRIRPVRIVWPDIRFTIDEEAFRLQDIPDFGKTVFLTREEAEEVLKRREEDA